MSAWDWLIDELERRLGKEAAAELWAEYRARARLDLEEAQLKEQLRRARMGSQRARRWLVERGYINDEGA